MDGKLDASTQNEDFSVDQIREVVGAGEEASNEALNEEDFDIDQIKETMESPEGAARNEQWVSTHKTSQSYDDVDVDNLPEGADRDTVAYIDSYCRFMGWPTWALDSILDCEKDNNPAWLPEDVRKAFHIHCAIWQAYEDDGIQP